MEFCFFITHLLSVTQVLDSYTRDIKKIHFRHARELRGSEHLHSPRRVTGKHGRTVVGENQLHGVVLTPPILTLMCAATYTQNTHEHKILI